MAHKKNSIAAIIYDTIDKRAVGFKLCDDNSIVGGLRVLEEATRVWGLAIACGAELEHSESHEQYET